MVKISFQARNKVTGVTEEVTLKELLYPDVNIFKGFIRAYRHGILENLELVVFTENPNGGNTRQTIPVEL